MILLSKQDGLSQPKKLGHEGHAVVSPLVGLIGALTPFINPGFLEQLVSVIKAGMSDTTALVTSVAPTSIG
jgi:hypothetical protein